MKGATILLAVGLMLETASADTCYCTVSQLNGRANPSKQSAVEAVFERGDEIELTGEKSGDWLEAIGGETGTVWVWNEYVSERTEPSRWKNVSGGRIRIRKSIGGKTVAWLKAGKTVKVTIIREGWGKTIRGWIDLSYMEEVAE